MFSARSLWESYGPLEGGALQAGGQASLRGLQQRPQLNGETVTVRGWLAETSRFVVTVQGLGENITVKAANLRAGIAAGREDWVHSENHLGPLHGDAALVVASCISVRGIGILSVVSRAVRCALWLLPEAEPLWETALQQRFGPAAAEVVLRARPGATGPSLYRGARGLRMLFREGLEIVKGGVHERANDMEVLACPCVSTLENFGVGAQGAVRRAAGAQLEEAVAQLPNPMPQRVMLVPGGFLSKKVAMTVTEITRDVMEQLNSNAMRRETYVSTLVDFLGQIHTDLFQAVREAGFRSLAMPTLCTGGVGIPAQLVAIAAVRAVHCDFLSHPADPLRVRVACYDPKHFPLFALIKDEALLNFFAPQQASDSIMSTTLRNSFMADDES